MLVRNEGTLVKIRFDRAAPNPSRAVEVEVVLDYVPSDDFTVPDNPGVLIPRSVTRTDTREFLELTDNEKRLVWREAANYVAANMR